MWCVVFIECFAIAFLAAYFKVYVLNTPLNSINLIQAFYLSVDKGETDTYAY